MISLKRGSFGEKSILSPTSYDKMWTPVADYGYSRPNIYEDYGLGWTLGHFQDVKTVGHGGGGCGWVGFLFLMPEKNRAAAFFCNEFSMGAGARSFTPLRTLSWIKSHRQVKFHGWYRSIKR